MSDLASMIVDTSNAISTLLATPVSLRQLAVRLYGDANRVGLLADIHRQRTEHVSHAALHDLRRRMGLSYDVRHVIDVPSDHDAEMYVTPNGTGNFHAHYCPPDAQIVIVPAGARIVQPKLPGPKRIQDMSRAELAAAIRNRTKLEQNIT